MHASGVSPQLYCRKVYEQVSLPVSALLTWEGLAVLPARGALMLHCAMLGQ